MSGSLQSGQTGTMSVAARNAAAVPISLGYYPREGSRCVPVGYDWTSTLGYNEDLSQLSALGVETTIQSIYVDNAACPYSVSIKINGTNQLINVEARSQGVFPAFFTGAPGYQISIQQVVAATTRLFLLNVVAPQGSWGIALSNFATNMSVMTLDATQVVTGGVAVQALTAGHRTAGGFIYNPPEAAANLGINELGTAVGTTSAGDTTFIVPGQSYQLRPSYSAVSVISSDSAHNFSGYGYM